MRPARPLNPFKRQYLVRSTSQCECMLRIVFDTASATCTPETHKLRNSMRENEKQRMEEKEEDNKNVSILCLTYVFKKIVDLSLIHI